QISILGQTLERFCQTAWVGGLAQQASHAILDHFAQGREISENHRLAHAHCLEWLERRNDLTDLEWLSRNCDNIRKGKVPSNLIGAYPANKPRDICDFRVCGNLLQILQCLAVPDEDHTCLYTLVAQHQRGCEEVVQALVVAQRSRVHDNKLALPHG